MVERLTSLDASFLYLEEPGTPMHVGGVLILEPPPGGLDALAALIEARLPLVPRYRQRVAEVPGHLANPVWVDDPDFDITYHVRRSALPRPGTEAQLLDLVSRVTSRPLDRAPAAVGDVPGRGAGRRPGRGHHQDPPGAGRRAERDRHRPGAARRRAGRAGAGAEPSGDPQRPPSGGPAARGRRWTSTRAGPRRCVDTVRGAVTDVRSTAARLTGVAGGLLRTARSTLLAGAAQPAERDRRAGSAGWRVARADLADIKTVRKAHGGTHQRRPAHRRHRRAARVAALPGASRSSPAPSVRALVPVSLQDERRRRGQPGLLATWSTCRWASPIRGCGWPGSATRCGASPSTASRVGADSLIALTGFAPPTLHALGARAARGLSRRLFNLVVTNVPGPQVPLYAAGGQMLEVFPVVPARPRAGPVDRHDQLRRAGLLRPERRPGQRR